MSGFERIEASAIETFHNTAALFQGDTQHPAHRRLDELKAMPYSEYLQTPEWQEIRRSMVRAAGFKCQRCRRGNRKLDVHHLTYERKGEEARQDLEVVCRDCHDETHGVIPLRRPQ